MNRAIIALEEVAWKHRFHEFKAACGHGPGLQRYGFPTPRIDRRTTEVWEPGMVFNIEGGPVHIDEGSHSLENTYVITSNSLAALQFKKADLHLLTAALRAARRPGMRRSSTCARISLLMSASASTQRCAFVAGRNCAKCRRAPGEWSPTAVSLGL